MKPLLFLRVFPIAVLMTLGCKSRNDELPVSGDEIAVPVQEFVTTTMQFYNKGKLQWKLEAESMNKPLTDTGKITVVPVVLTFFDSTGATQTRVLADSGRIANTMSSYNVWGNVYIRTHDSMVVRTERLRYFKERAKIESDTFVQIETPKGDILRGKGLVATEDFSRFSFKSQVTGKFPDFEQRVETGNDTIF